MPQTGVGGKRQASKEEHNRKSWEKWNLPIPGDSGNDESVGSSPGDFGYAWPYDPDEGDIYDTENPDMAINWGELAGAVVNYGIDYAQGQTSNFVQSMPQIANGGAGPPPSKVTVDTRTGQVTKCRRRRRRRLLTASDLSDLASLKAIVGGGAAMNAAVVKAVRR